MTVSTASYRAEYTGNASTTAFAVVDTLGASAVIPVSDASHLQVYVDGTLKVEDTHYTVSIVTATKAATVTFITSPTDYTPASDATIVILRVVPYTQLQDYVNNDAFDAENVETALDQLTQETQQLADDKDRTIKFDSTIHLSDFDSTAETASKITANQTSRANKVLSFDSVGDINTTQEIGTWQGAWATGTTYYVRDLIRQNDTGAVYICTTEHESETFTTDLGNWSAVIDAGGFNVKLTANLEIGSGETYITPYKLDLNGYTLENNGTLICAEIITGDGTLTTAEGATTTQSGPVSVGGASFVTPTGTQTLTNKRLTSPKINEDVVMSATATELNVMDGSATTQATVTLAGTDGVVISDGDVMKQALVSDFDTYVSSTASALTNKTSITVDNLNLNANTLSSTTGAINYDTNGTSDHVFKVGTATALTISYSGGDTTITGPPTA